MPDPADHGRAEIVDDLTTSLAPARVGGPSALADRGWRLLPAAVFTALALAALAVTWKPPNAATGPTPGLPTVAPLAAAPTATLHPGPTEPPPACSSSDFIVRPASDPYVPDSTLPIELPPGGRAAFAVPQAAVGGGVIGGSVVVAAAQPDGSVAARQIATYEGGGYGRPLAKVVGSAINPGVFLLEIDGIELATERSCAALFTVTADGAILEVKTPDQKLSAAAISPTLGRVAYLTESGFLFWPQSPDGGATGVSCDNGHSVAWSSDEERLLAICDDREIVVAEMSGGVTRFGPLDTLPLAAAWSPASPGHVLLVTTPLAVSDSSPLTVWDVDVAARLASTLWKASESLRWAGVAMSPSGRWLLLGASPEGGDFASPQVARDLSTGTEAPVPGDAAPFEFEAQWLPGGDAFLTLEYQRIYRTDLRSMTREPVGYLQAEKFTWLPEIPG
jgi:hypothetical protein